jgi:Family of unknown function (DUF6152)
MTPPEGQWRRREIRRRPFQKGTNMNFYLLRLATCVFGLLIISTPLTAHHSFMGEYDLSKPISLTGTVTRVEWANPHISFEIDVRDKTGTVTHWTLEAASPTALVGRGWTATTLKVGAVVTVQAFPAKRNRPFAATQKVTFGDGRTLSAESDGVRPE